MAAAPEIIEAGETSDVGMALIAAESRGDARKGRIREKRKDTRIRHDTRIRRWQPDKRTTSKYRTCSTGGTGTAGPSAQAPPHKRHLHMQHRRHSATAPAPPARSRKAAQARDKGLLEDAVRQRECWAMRAAERDFSVRANQRHVAVLGRALVAARRRSTPRVARVMSHSDRLRLYRELPREQRAEHQAPQPGPLAAASPPDALPVPGPARPLAELYGEFVGAGGLGLAVHEPFISRFPTKTAEMRKGACRKAEGTRVILFACGTGQQLGGRAAWVARFRARFLRSEPVARGQVDDDEHYRAHQCSPTEVASYLHGYPPEKAVYLWHFGDLEAIAPTQLRACQPGEQRWVHWTLQQLLLDNGLPAYM